MKNLASLCRICGNRLKKLKETYQITYTCKNYREFLEKKFQINTEIQLIKIAFYHISAYKMERAQISFRAFCPQRHQDVVSSR